MSRSLIMMGLIVGLNTLAGPARGQSPGAQPAGPVEGKIDPAVYASLEKSADQTALVEVTLTPVHKEGPSTPDVWRRVSKIQDDVLARLGQGTFKVVYRPNLPPAMMVVYANAAALDKLASDPDVVMARLCKVTSDVHAKLAKNDDNTAFVCIVLQVENKQKIKKAQDEVQRKYGLANLWRFETEAMLVGDVSAEDIARLAKDPAIVMSRPSKAEPAVFTKLKESKDGMTDVIVSFKYVPGRLHLQPEERKPKIEKIKRAVLSGLKPGEFRTVHKFTGYHLLSGFASLSGLAKLEAHPDVIGITASSRFVGNLSQSVPYIHADIVHAISGITGEGITVASFDTGIDPTNPDVQGSIAPGAYHFLSRIGGGTGAGAPDGDGHGTTVAAIITAPNGVAPDAQILPVKVVGDDGTGFVLHVAEGVVYVVDHHNDHPNVAVISTSLTTQTLYSACPCDSVDCDTVVLNDVPGFARA